MKSGKSHQSQTEIILKIYKSRKFLDDKEQIKEDAIKILKLCRNPNNLIEYDPFCAGLIVGDTEGNSSMETVSSIARQQLSGYNYFRNSRKFNISNI